PMLPMGTNKARHKTAHERACCWRRLRPACTNAARSTNIQASPMPTSTATAAPRTGWGMGTALIQVSAMASVARPVGTNSPSPVSPLSMPSARRGAYPQHTTIDANRRAMAMRTWATSAQPRFNRVELYSVRGTEPAECSGLLGDDRIAHCPNGAAAFGADRHSRAQRGPLHRQPGTQAARQGL